MSRVVVVLLSAAVGLMAVYALMSALDERSAPAIVIEAPATPATFRVAVNGAVARPGVYAVAATARLADAVAAAGGLAPDADLAALNLARRLNDGDAIVIPAVGAAPPAPTAPPARTAATKPTPEQTTAPAVLDLNTASAEEFDALPGIGPVLAQRIVDDRTQNGPFASVDDLARVQGISQRMVDALRSQLVVR